MRLAGISTIEAGNQFLPAFMADYNRRFAKEPRSDKDLHRPVSEHDQLDEAFAWKEDRTVSNSLTLQYDHVLFILEPNAVRRPRVGAVRGRACSRWVELAAPPQRG